MCRNGIHQQQGSRLQRNSYADVTSYGRGYDRRDVVLKTKTRKLKYYNCPRCPCGQCTRKPLRRAHADVTSYGRGYNHRDRCFENPNKTIQILQLPRCPCGQCTRKPLRRTHAVGLSSSRTLVGNSSCEVIKLAVSSMKLTKRVAGFIVFLISCMVLPWVLKTWKSKCHVAMRANEPAILLAEAMGHWQLRCLRPVNLQSFVRRRKSVSI